MGWLRITVAATCGAMAVCGTGAPGVAAADDGSHAKKKPQLMFQSTGERPGQLVDLEVTGVRTRHEKIVVSSPAFSHPLRLAYHQDPMMESAWGLSYRARAAIAMKTGPGAYPLTVEIAGRVTERGTVHVVAAPRPSFEVTGDLDGQRPGAPVGLSYDDLYPGETGTSFTVRSKAFKAPVPLKHDENGGYWHLPRMFEAAPDVRPDAKDGTYKVVLTGPKGQVIDEGRLKVRASRPGDYDYTGKGRGPEFYRKRGDIEVSGRHFRVKAGGRMQVVWRDGSPDPGEEERLTATSPAFEGPVRLKRDDSKAGDGDDPRFYGSARIRSDLDGGSYPVTVVSHHGRVKRSNGIVVTAAPGHHADKPGQDDAGSGGIPPMAVIGAGAGTLAMGAAVIMLRRARRARADDSR
ncbi:hypothetical protein ACIRPT_14555 [Streptomyces sp. NPDC101227]|uniref:hypothetical protein n=1 Tax=Streptomyces sp. NPDC101227 TaxID=3366136 RepID=UPI00380C62CD